MKKLILVLFIIIFLALSATAQAMIITGEFSGYFHSVTGPDDLLNEIGIGTEFSGTFSYDSDSPILDPYHEDPPVYNADDSFSIEYTIFGNTETHHWTGGGAWIWVSDTVSVDSFSTGFIDGWAGTIAGYKPDEGSLDLSDSSGTAFNDASLPTELNLEDFDSNSIWLLNAGSPASSFEIWGTLESLTAQHVPIPSAIWLFGSGLIGLVGLRRKFRR